MRTILALVIVMCAAVLQTPQLRASVPVVRNGHVRTFWPNGHAHTDVTYAHDAYEGEYRTWYQSGAPYERRHFVNGHEVGVQQSWTEGGELFLNYEVRDGRRFGLVNATPCVPVSQGTTGKLSSVPYYDTADFTPRWSPVVHQVASFQLQTQTDAAVSERDLAGHVYVASFLFTHCTTVCPAVVSQLARVQQALAGMPDSRIVSYTVTPDLDTPAVLAAFGKTHRIDPGRWLLVTGDKQQIYRLARESYFTDDARARPSAGASDDALLHTEKLVLVDAEGRLRGIYNGTQPREIDHLIDDMQRLQAEP